MTEHPVYAKVNLQETKYKPGFRNLDYKLLPKDTDPAPLLEIYRQYAIYKKFQSTWQRRNSRMDYNFPTSKECSMEYAVCLELS